MKWFRSNVRLGSRLALFALAIQFVLSFGHFHSGDAQAASAAATRSGLHHIVPAAAAQSPALGDAAPARAARMVRSKTFSGHGPAGHPAHDDCAICAMMALAGAMVVVTPPDLVVPQAVALLQSRTDAGFVDLHSSRVAFQPRGPPSC
jgi:hypothetical protein